MLGEKNANFYPKTAILIFSLCVPYAFMIGHVIHFSKRMENSGFSWIFAYEEKRLRITDEIKGMKEVR